MTCAITCGTPSRGGDDASFHPTLKNCVFVLIEKSNIAGITLVHGLLGDLGAINLKLSFCKYYVVSKVLSVLMSCVFVAPYLNKYLFYCVLVYTDRWRILHPIH